MKITVKDIIQVLEAYAPLALQENYDNAGLIVGSNNVVVTKILITLDTTEAVVNEAIAKGCNLILAHHPIVFSGLKKLNGNNYVERTVIKAIKHDIAIYASHTNLDNVFKGVNLKIAQKLGLQNLQLLAPASGKLKKLAVFVPNAHATQVQNALFSAGAGYIGNYSECSFAISGEGTFNGNANAQPFAGERGIKHSENEIRLEVVYTDYLEQKVIAALLSVHPYEEVAYDLYQISNLHQQIGAGLIGNLPKSISQKEFLALVQKNMNVNTIRYTSTHNEYIHKVAVCGGSGSFLIKTARSKSADAFITSDVKYHEFFDAENKLMIADIGHYESEIFTKDLLKDIIIEKFPTFAVLLSETNTNPINYYTS